MMLALSDFRDWLKTLDVAENYYIGRLDAKQEKSLGVYNLTRRGAPIMALGGAAQSSYDVKSVSLLLHWNRNARETEAAAHVLWNKLLRAGRPVTPGGVPIQYIQLTVPEPIAVDTDDNGVYEYVIEMNIYYRR